MHEKTGIFMEDGYISVITKTPARLFGFDVNVEIKQGDEFDTRFL